MEKEFIPYSQALALKELGFDEPCFGYYTGDIKHLVIRANMGRRNEDLNDVVCTAPLYQQAFRWFREKYDLGNYIFPKRVNKKTKWKYQTLFIEEVSANHLPMQLEPSKCFKTYEEAELECLKKLIEVCKNK